MQRLRGRGVDGWTVEAYFTAFYARGAAGYTAPAPPSLPYRASRTPFVRAAPARRLAHGASAAEAPVPFVKGLGIMDLLGSLSQDAQPEYAKCSRKGCQQAAEFQLLWNNPKVHTPERRKIWLACSEHVGWLENYLREREFWKQTLPFDGSEANSSE